MATIDGNNFTLSGSVDSGFAALTDVSAGDAGDLLGITSSGTLVEILVGLVAHRQSVPVNLWTLLV